MWALKGQRPNRQAVYAGILPPSQPGVAAAAAGEAATCDPPSLFQQIMQFVPPVDWEYDVPLVDRDPGTHVFLDTLAAVLINYQMDVMNTEDKDAAREKIGETVWPHVVEGIGAEMAPHITGMREWNSPRHADIDPHVHTQGCFSPWTLAVCCSRLLISFGSAKRSSKRKTSFKRASNKKK